MSVRSPIVMLLVVSLVPTSLAFAGTPTGSPSPSTSSTISDADRATARALFSEGVKLFEEGNYEGAAAKFAAAYGIAPMGAVAMNLGRAYQSAGKAASAWAAYRDATDRFVEEGKADRAEECRARALALEAQLGRLKIDVTPGNPISLTLSLDGGVVAKGTSIVDTGSHVVVARAIGRKPWTTTVVVAKGQTTVTVTVPLLQKA